MMRKVRIVSAALFLLGLSPSAQAELTVRAVAAGLSHGLALVSDGTVWAWGGNFHGQLGDGTNTNRPIPVQVAGLSGVAAIAAGSGHSLALKNDGTVWAWGGTASYPGTTPRPPAQVSGLSGVVALAGGGTHSLALTNDGTVWAWGDNSWGQLGDGTQTPRATPAPVRGLAGVTAIAAGQAHSLVVKSDGTVWAWGHNWYGQLGDGSVAPERQSPSLPVQVSGIAGVVTVAAGYGHSLALKGDGTVWAWGHNGLGQLGDGASGDLQPTPVQVSGLTRVAAVVAIGYGSLALKSDGTVWNWGVVGINSARPVPAQVNGLVGAVAVAGSLILKGDGTVWALDCLGCDRTAARRVAPGQVSGLTGVAAVAAGSNSDLALKSDGTVWERSGQSAPLHVSGLSEVVAIASGSAYNLALKGAGTVWEWGGQSTPFQSTPVQVSGLTGVVAVAAGESRSLAVKGDGTVWQWVWEWWESVSPPAPAPVSGLSGVVAVAVAFEWWWGDDFLDLRCLALKGDGTVWAWDEEGAPVQVRGLTGIVAIAGGGTSLALKGDGTVWEWNAEDMARPAPVQVGGLTSVVAVAVGPHRLALKSDGTVWAWGANAYGQLGDGTTTRRSAPVQVGGIREVAAVAAARYHSLAAKRDGTVWAWGAWPLGETGEPNTPVQVLPPGWPDLAIAMRHDSDFTAGNQGVYALTITNTGATPTGGTITVTDALPPGLAYVSAVGSGWSCSAADEIVTCTNPGPVNPGASSTIMLTVEVGAAAWPGVTNLATVTNASDRNLSNNTTGDPTAVLAGRD